MLAAPERSLRVGRQLSWLPDLGVFRQKGKSVISDAAINGPTSNASANTKGSYTEAFAATSYDAYGIILTVTPGSTVRDYLFDIAVGADTAEVVIVPNLLISGQAAGTQANGLSIVIPIFIPAGSRVATRCAASTGSGAMPLSLNLIYQRSLVEQPMSCEAYGAATADSGGTSVDPGGTINTYGSYVTLGTTTKRITQLLCLVGNQLNAARSSFSWRVDVGQSGNEITNLLLIAHATLDFMLPQLFGPFPVDIPAGATIRARAKCNGNDATDRLFDLVAYGFSPSR